VGTSHRPGVQARRLIRRPLPTSPYPARGRACGGMILTPREFASLAALTALVARIEARTGKRLTTEQPGRGSFVALLDGVPVHGVYGSRQEAVEAL